VFCLGDGEAFADLHCAAVSLVLSPAHWKWIVINPKRRTPLRLGGGNSDFPVEHTGKGKCIDLM